MDLMEFCKLVLKEYNKPVFYVGGCVRDSFLGIQTSDVDICSANIPEDIIKICNKFNIKFYPSGIRFGTVSIILNEQIFEHTTWRSECKNDGRHAVVNFTDDVNKDAMRRDFTFNAIYQNVISGDLIDPFNGIKDLENKNIVFIGNTNDRIKEDYLRIFRFIRFINRFSFNYKNDDLDVIINDISGIDILSDERVSSELIKIFKDGIRCNDILKQVINKGSVYSLLLKDIDRLINTSQNHPFHSRNNVWDHTVDVINQVVCNGKDILDINIYCAFFHDFFKPDTLSISDDGITHFYGHDRVHDEFKNIMDRWKISKKDRRIIAFFITFHLLVSILIQDISNKKSISDKRWFNIFYKMYSFNKDFVDVFVLLKDMWCVENCIKFNKDYQIEIEVFLKRLYHFKNIVNSIDKKKIADSIKNKKDFDKVFKRNVQKKYNGI